MILENFTALEICVFVALIILGIAFILSVVMPPIFAWADRWIDRTRNSVTDRVESDKEQK